MNRLIIAFILLTVHKVFSETCPPKEDIWPCFCTDSTQGIGVLCLELESLQQLVNSVHGLNEKNIIYFEIKNSNIEYIPYDLFENLIIKELSISQSNFSRVGALGQPQFKGLENSLEVLKFTSAFSRFHPLAYFSLDHFNRLTTLEVRKSYVESIHNEWFKRGPNSLKIVRFVESKIKRLGYRAFNHLTNLRILDISENELTYIPRSALPQPANLLEELNMERNKMEVLPEDFFSSMPNLKKVNLELNEFSTINEELWKPVWNHLEFINIDYNPLICDKQIKWMYHSSENLKKKLIATCFKPFKLTDRELHSLKPEELK